MQNQKCPISCSYWKRCYENSQEIPRRPFTTECILIVHNYAEYDLCCWCFCRNIWKLIRTVILKEFLRMDTPYLIEEYLQMSASGEAKLKFPMWERQMFQKKEFFCHKKIFFCILIYYNCSHWGSSCSFCYKDFSVHLLARFHFMNTNIYLTILIFCSCKYGG